MSGSVDAVVNVAWLAKRMNDPSVIVVDTRWYMATDRDGRSMYDNGHLPGAHFVDLDDELSSSPRSPLQGRHPLPSTEAFAALLGRLGVHSGSKVVAYDDRGGAIAARLWWLLRYFGLGHVGLVLEGGIDAWTAAGHELETGSGPPPASTEPPAITPNPALIIDADTARAFARSSASVLIDARAIERYRGQTEPIDPRPGHIPGAQSAPITGNLDSSGAFLPVDVLRERYVALGVGDTTEVAVYCGSGVTACHGLLALDRLGRSDAKLFVGSWSAWSSDPQRPAATAAKMTVAELEAFRRERFPQAHRSGATLVDVSDGECWMTLLCDEEHLRPGGTVSGPTLMALSDQAMYLALLATIGPVALAVTTNLNINFLRRPQPGLLCAHAKLLKVGSRLAVGEVTMTRDEDGGVVSHATVTYSVPPTSAPASV